ncbi:MAG: hypothetical protein HQK96_18525 [Nitrospirae bacterium]|nr:hypothetical protein [Nitrospirota bacterium]
MLNSIISIVEEGVVSNFSKVKKVLEYEAVADVISRNSIGNVIIRRGFYYTFGETAENFLKVVTAVLDKAGVRYDVVDSGEVYKRFVGSANIANSSHWYVEIKLKPDTDVHAG